MNFIKKQISNFMQMFTLEDFASPYDLSNLPSTSTPGKYFTQAEQQLLQRVLCDHLNMQEAHRKSVLEKAKYFKSVDPAKAKAWFKQHRKTKADIKKLVALQTKVRYTLEIRG